jgi:vesicle-associated membrane protein 7
LNQSGSTTLPFSIFADSLVERGEKLELLVDKTENLSASAVSFKTASTNLQRKLW